MTALARWSLALALLGGCAASSTVQTRTTGDGTSFESQRVRLASRDMSGAIGVRDRVFWQASASCAGPGCVPTEVDLAFVNGSDFELDVDPRKVEVTVDGLSRAWPNPDIPRDRIGQRIPRGEFLRITVSADDFAQLAEAGEVRVAFGSTGTAPFVASRASRAPFRDLARAISAP
ncbi:hypothetical protein [Rubrivirga sp.]|uniref:hypothetical protein n=1 Tax=Rubrivirga sp. TaxID=1885344 RepID=UPI003B51F792